MVDDSIAFRRRTIVCCRTKCIGERDRQFIRSFHPKSHSKTRLRIGVNKQYFFAAPRKSNAEVFGSCSFANTTFLFGNGNDFCLIHKCLLQMKKPLRVTLKIE